MKIKAMNLLVLGAAFAAMACSSEKDDEDSFDLSGEESDADADADSDADSDADADADVNIDGLVFMWDGVFIDGTPGSGFISKDVFGEEDDRPVSSSFSSLFLGENWAGSWADTANYCLVQGDVDLTASSRSGWDTWDGFAFDFDAAAVDWQLQGDACEEAALKIGVDVIDFMTEQTWGIGYGPFESDFETSYSDYVNDNEGDYAGEDAGSVFQGTLFAQITGEDEFHIVNTCTANEMDADGQVLFDADKRLVRIDGAADVETPVDGYYDCNFFFGFGWS